MNNYFMPSSVPAYTNYNNYKPMQQVYNSNYNNVPADLPMQGIPYVTEEEAKAYIILPNTKILLMDRDKSVFYIKTTDQLGKSTLEGFSYTKIDDLSNASTTNIDTSQFVTTKELDEKLKNMLTADDLKSIDSKLEQIQRQVRANQILRGEESNG